MIRIPITNSINICIAPWFKAFAIKEFNFKLPKDFILFHLETKIKSVRLILFCFVGIEIIEFFNEKEFNAIMKILEAGSRFTAGLKEDKEDNYE